MLSKETFEKIYRDLDRVTPLDTDCGLLCGCACCTGAYADGEEMGIFLLPGEEQLFSPGDDWLDWSEEDAGDLGFPDSWPEKVPFMCRLSTARPLRLVPGKGGRCSAARSRWHRI